MTEKLRDLRLGSTGDRSSNICGLDSDLSIRCGSEAWMVEYNGADDREVGSNPRHMAVVEQLDVDGKEYCESKPQC